MFEGYIYSIRKKNNGNSNQIESVTIAYIYRVYEKFLCYCLIRK